MGRLTEIERQHLECLKVFHIEPAGVVNEYRRRRNIFGWEMSLSDFIEGSLVATSSQKAEELLENRQTSGFAHALKRPINHVANYGFGHLEQRQSRRILEEFRHFRVSRAINKRTQLSLPVNWDIIYAPTRYSIYGLLEAVEI